MIKIAKRMIISMGILTLFFAFAVSVFAASNIHYNYTITTSSIGQGPNKYLSNAQKEYSNVTMTCTNSSAIGDVSLWKAGIPDVYFGNDQTFVTGQKNTAWWYGGDAGNYHISIRVAGNRGAVVTTTGTLQNRS